MKKLFIFYGFITLVFFSCESSSEESESEVLQIFPNLTELVESKTLFDGEEITIYTDIDNGELFTMKDEELVDIEQLSDSGQLIFYFNAEFSDYLIFTSKDKMRSTIENSNTYSELVDKVKNLDPSMIRTTSLKSASANASSPSVTIATAHSFGGQTFTKTLPYPTRYGNPHLRCNQYETNCIDFNDKISSIKISQGVFAEFYTGSFLNTEQNHLYLDGGNGAVQITNLSGVWNDRITSFWASTASTYESLTFFPGLRTCGHNYNDPSCP